jgi:hypothetical protein
MFQKGQHPVSGSRQSGQPYGYGEVSLASASSELGGGRGTDWLSWRSLLPDGAKDSTAKLLRGSGAPERAFISAFQFRVLRFHDDYRFFMFIRRDAKGFINYDFAAFSPPARGRREHCNISASDSSTCDFRFHLGLFLGERRLSEGYRGEYRQ